MRIRSIKPEFWRSEDVAALAPEDRLLFIGLWSYVDDNGVGRDSLAEVAADLFALDLARDARETFARVSRGLSKLADAGLILRYTVSGRAFLAVTGWSRHQRIDHANKARYPGPDQAFHDTGATPSRVPREFLAPGTGEQGNRGTGEQRNKDSSEPSSDPREPGTELALLERPAPPARKTAEYPARFEEFWHAYPRREGKRKAFAAWQNALRRSDADAILAGAIRYAQDPNRDPAFTAHPTTWLNRDGWDDAPLPKRRPDSSQERLQDSRTETLAALSRMGVA